MASSVDLPQPDGPEMETYSPRCISMWMPDRAWVSTSSVTKTLVTPSRWINGSDAVMRFEYLSSRDQVLTVTTSDADYWFKRILGYDSYCDISDRITRSPAFSPSRTSMVFTEARPSLTFTRSALFPSGAILKSPMVAPCSPDTGRSTNRTLSRCMI